MEKNKVSKRKYKQSNGLLLDQIFSSGYSSLLDSSLEYKSKRINKGRKNLQTKPKKVRKTSKKKAEKNSKKKNL